MFRYDGKNVDGVEWWRDTVLFNAKQVVYAWGLNLVVLTLRVNPLWGVRALGLPINMRMHRENGLSLTKLTEEMLVEDALWLDERRFQCY